MPYCDVADAWLMACVACVACGTLSVCVAGVACGRYTGPGACVAGVPAMSMIMHAHATYAFFVIL